MMKLNAENRAAYRASLQEILQILRQIHGLTNDKQALFEGEEPQDILGYLEQRQREVDKLVILESRFRQLDQAFLKAKKSGELEPSYVAEMEQQRDAVQKLLREIQVVDQKDMALGKEKQNSYKQSAVKARGNKRQISAYFTFQSGIGYEIDKQR